MESSSELTLEVTDSQYEAITFPLDDDKILKIIAGPGAGKTRTLVSKVAYSLGQGVKPEEILVLSLTNRAVFALKSQLSELVGEELANQVNIQTFHAYSISVVSTYYSNDWRLLEDVGWKTLINVTYNPSSAKGYHEKRLRKLTRNEMEQIINLANSGLSSQEISETFKNRLTQNDVEAVLGWVYHSKIVTYKDLIRTATAQIQKNQEIASKFKTVIVDEFQDMYGDLLELVKLIARTKNLVIAGDPNQSIFRFLGSHPQIMYTFDKEFTNKETTVITLNECFRSTPEIIKVADAMVKAVVPRKHIKELGHLPIFKTFNSDAEECAFIVSELNRILNSSNGLVKPRDILILGRTNKKIDNIRDCLEAEGLETVKLASIQSWIDTYLYHFIDYLHILSDPAGSDHSLMSVLALLDNVGNVTLRNLMKEVSEKNMALPMYDQVSLWGHLKTKIKESQKADKLFGRFVKSIEQINSEFHNSCENPDEIMKILLSISEEFGLKKKILKSSRTSQDSLKYQDHLKKFYENLCSSYNTKAEETPLVEYFLKHYNDVPILQDDKLINLSTIHSAKGLEFPICFVLAKEELYPNQVEDPEDERRNLYVAITRASALLYYNKIQDNFKTNETLINRNELRQYFSFKEPSFTPDFWSKYSKSLSNPIGIRHFHTYRRQTYCSNQLFRSAQRLCRRLVVN